MAPYFDLQRPAVPALTATTLAQCEHVYLFFIICSYRSSVRTHCNHLHVLAHGDRVPISTLAFILFAIYYCRSSACTLIITGTLTMDDDEYRHHLCSQRDNGADNNNCYCIPCHFYDDDVRPSPGKSFPHHRHRHH